MGLGLFGVLAGCGLRGQVEALARNGLGKVFGGGNQGVQYGGEQAMGWEAQGSSFRFNAE